MAAAFSTGRSAACGALLGSATERSRVWRWRALRSSRAACGAFNFARSMPEVDTGRLNSRDARTAWATLRQVAADGRVASDGRVTSEGSRVASEGMVVSEGAARRRAAGAPDSPPTAREPQILIKKPYSSKNMSDLLLLYLLARRRGADTAHTKMGRPTYEAPTREYTHKHTQTQTIVGIIRTGG